MEVTFIVFLLPAIIVIQSSNCFFVSITDDHGAQFPALTNGSNEMLQSSSDENFGQGFGNLGKICHSQKQCSSSFECCDTKQSKCVLISDPACDHVENKEDKLLGMSITIFWVFVGLCIFIPILIGVIVYAWICGCYCCCLNRNRHEQSRVIAYAQPSQPLYVNPYAIAPPRFSAPCLVGSLASGPVPAGTSVSTDNNARKSSGTGPAAEPTGVAPSVAANASYPRQQ